MPPQCTGVIEVEIELMTGRSHQIRGQLSALGFPLCGDAMYGGFMRDQPESLREGHQDGFMDSEMLALQCCELQFLDPDYEVSKKGKQVAIRSDRINKFRLERAWLSPFIDKYSGNGDNLPTSHDDLATASQMRDSNAAHDEITVGSKSGIEKDEINGIQLSSGQNKYIVVKASSPNLDEPKWFIKSASPDECGGPYHADVARDLVSRLNVAGYDTVVCGGGRIDYDVVKRHAHVYGFSYGFGKGDHAFVSLLIEQDGYSSSFDDSDTLY